MEIYESFRRQYMLVNFGPHPEDWFHLDCACDACQRRVKGDFTRKSIRNNLHMSKKEALSLVIEMARREPLPSDVDDYERLVEDEKQMKAINLARYVCDDLTPVGERLSRVLADIGRAFRDEPVHATVSAIAVLLYFLPAAAVVAIIISVVFYS